MAKLVVVVSVALGKASVDRLETQTSSTRGAKAFGFVEQIEAAKVSFTLSVSVSK